MNYIHVHFRPNDGEIVGYENTTNPQPQPGCEIVSIPVEDGRHLIPNARQHRIDLLTFELVDKTAEEQRIASLPTLAIVRQVVAQELAATDQFMMADRPMTKADRAAWKSYRQALRDLSKLAGPVEMLETWPVRPDGRLRPYVDI